ncbi:MAG: CHAT domain-containing protein [Gammaproteobacteria bacterium]|nr:CHAT domain-containing protein [Gammaproteobacteria bacterium]
MKTAGTQPVTGKLSVQASHTYLIEVDERDNDALIEVLDPTNHLLARADHPERRTGTRRAILTARASSLVVRATGKEHAGVSGTAIVRVFDLAPLQERTDCLAIVKALAQADADYAAGQEISRGLTSTTANARNAYLRAAGAYTAAEHALRDSPDEQLRGRTALALAGLEYQDLQDWAQAADWARIAATELAPGDSYRKARAEALLAAAWIEIGSAASAASPADESAPLTRARRLLRQLVQFHMARGERYDAGLQLTNIGVTYVYQGRYAECIKSSVDASRLFGTLHETPRQALARQNQALCLWGLGRLPEALYWFERALPDIGPEPYPNLHLIVMANTALAHYAVGHFDESLRLYDQALAFAQKVQSARDEARCLYGIGVNYYALGDRQRAREFLERSLAIRTVAVDGRGRMASLRALANVDGEQGRVEQALAADSEALALAVAPPTIGRIKIQQAVHTEAAGRGADARALLDEVLASSARADPLIEAEARLERAKLLRHTGRPDEALKDLALARPRLHAFGGVMEEFEADLELARALRQLGRPQEALGAVDRALGQSASVRLETANPELRAQLQEPLRPAYDLKLELLRDRYERALTGRRRPEAGALAAQAFMVADASRAHSFADIAAQSYSPEVRSALAPELRRRETLYRELAARRFALDDRLERSGPTDPRVKHLVADIAELRREVDTLNTAIASRTTTKTPSGGVRQPQGVPSLPASTALVSYWLGSDSAYAWVVAGGEIQWARLDSPGSISDQARAFHHSLTRLVDVPVERRLHDGRALYAMVLRPLEPWLSAAWNWIIIPDGALDYVPFAALEAGEGHRPSFVALRHDVSVTPAAWMLEAGRTHAPLAEGQKILIVADPVYQPDDPRLPTLRTTSMVAPAPTHFDGTRGEYRRLRYTGEEATGISAQFPQPDVHALIGVDATRERLLALDWSQYRFIHIATHGIVDAQVPELSALILGSYDSNGAVADGAVRVADVALQTLTAEIVVLSACETALGTELRSEGLYGMSSVMLARGARAVVASLWPVPDKSGARLMTEFYGHMLHDSMSPAAALGMAMRSRASSEASSDPALWAAFQISVRSFSASRH